MEYLCCGSKKKKKGPPGHRTNFQKSVDQNQSFFYSWPYFEKSQLLLNPQLLLRFQLLLNAQLLLNGPVYIELSSSYLMLTIQCVSAIECSSRYLILSYI